MTKLLTFKKHLNQLAELGWEEKKTTTYILRSLLPIEPVVRGFGESKTGLLYKIGKAKDGILLRADIDALKVDNTVAHICGHSSHTASLMQALLSSKEKIIASGKSVWFLFQPSEENYPSGAKAFINEQAKILPKIRFAFAAHVRPQMPVGSIGLVSGPIMARGDYMEIEIHGKMVHIKNTPQGKDALEAAAYIILFVKSLQKKYGERLRINIGTIQGGLQANTVADRALLKGDIRMKDETLQREIKRTLQKEIKRIEKLVGVNIDFRYYDGYPVVKNEKKLVEHIKDYFTKKKTWHIQDNSSFFSFGCEDFCFISQKIPSIFALIGTGDRHDIHEAHCTISNEGTEKVYEYFTGIIDWWLNS